MGSLSSQAAVHGGEPGSAQAGGRTASPVLSHALKRASMPTDGFSFSEDTPPTDIRVGNYRIVRRIGQGGWGEVFEAHHVHGLRAAIKVLRARVQATPGRLQRFFREAIAAGTIHHPGIVRVFDVGRLSDGSAYILMELIRGESLRRYLQRHGLAPLPQAQLISIGHQLASAMAAVHIHDIVHRDLKPENIMVTQDGASDDAPLVKLVDFGIAKFLQPDALGGPLVQTSEGSRPGTPDYMAPEQVLRGAVSDRTDVYALGLILIELCTGRPLVSQSLGRSKRPPALQAVPPALRPLITRMLSFEPQERPSMAYIAQALAAMARRRAAGSAMSVWRAALTGSWLRSVGVAAGLLLLCSIPARILPEPSRSTADLPRASLPSRELMADAEPPLPGCEELGFTPPAHCRAHSAFPPPTRPADAPIWAATPTRGSSPPTVSPPATSSAHAASSSGQPSSSSVLPSARSSATRAHNTSTVSLSARSFRSQLDALASKYQRRHRSRHPSDSQVIAPGRGPSQPQG